MKNIRTRIQERYIAKNDFCNISEKDMFVEIIPGDESLSVRGITSEFLSRGVCLVKISGIHKFDTKNSVLWQIAEGLMNRNHEWFFGYDNAVIRNIIVKNIQDVFIDKAIRYREIVRIIVQFENGELSYLEVINSN